MAVFQTVLSTWDELRNQSTQSLSCAVGVSLAHFRTGKRDRGRKRDENTAYKAQKAQALPSHCSKN